MTLYSKHIITGEKLYRSCAVCRNDKEACNYCHWKPISMKNHKHLCDWSEQMEGDTSWFGKLLGKKSRIIKYYCRCSKLMKTQKDNKMMEIRI